ncbi:MAG: fumarate hydratase, partial [Candidatus Omnitrophica bacterium]|nr:fumarate hydratase [Candidatus Omnitrophota bacterium]
DIEKALRRALEKETKKNAKNILKILLENANIARNEKIAICQDTGIVVCDIRIGQDVKIIGGDLKKAINDGVNEGYKKGYFRKSVVNDPILRKGPSGYIPAVIYTDVVRGNKMEITVSPKGFGSENKSKIKMLNPTDGIEKIKEFIISVVKEAGANACPPFILGIGIGGSFDKAALLSKRALFRPIHKRNPKPHLKKLENEILIAVNRLNIGPMGLGGKTTCLGVNIMDAPTHIAGLPVAVNVGCHATRSVSKVI